MDIIKALKKAPNVKRELNKNWALEASSGGGNGGSIFDDFFGDMMGAQSRKKEEPKKEEGKLTLNEPKILEIVTYDQC